MKTFKDLIFKSKDMPKEYEGTQATLDFNNGYGISVITGDGAYVSPDKPYEIAVLKEGRLFYDTPITSDVIGHLTAKEVTKIMKQIQKLPSIYNALVKLKKRLNGEKKNE